MRIVFISFVLFFGCSSVDVENIQNKCIDDCCYSNEFNCNDFTYDGKNPYPFPVKCQTKHYDKSWSSNVELVIDNKNCYRMTNDLLTFCCQKP